MTNVFSVFTINFQCFVCDRQIADPQNWGNALPLFGANFRDPEPHMPSNSQWWLWRRCQHAILLSTAALCCHACCLDTAIQKFPSFRDIFPLLPTGPQSPYLDCISSYRILIHQSQLCSPHLQVSLYCSWSTPPIEFPESMSLYLTFYLFRPPTRAVFFGKPYNHPNTKPLNAEHHPPTVYFPKTLCHPLSRYTSHIAGSFS